jgi:cytochrome bd-type quinol oxidase subunit 2
MLQPPPPIRAVPPAPLRTARVILWIQAALIALLVIVQFAAISELTDHGEAVGGYNSFVVADNVVLFVVALIAALLIVKKRLARGFAFVAEALAILNGILNLAHGMFAGVVECGLGIAVVILLLNPQTTNWYDEAGSAAEPGDSGNQ